MWYVMLGALPGLLWSLYMLPSIIAANDICCYWVYAQRNKNPPIVSTIMFAWPWRWVRARRWINEQREWYGEDWKRKLIEEQVDEEMRNEREAA